MSAKVIDAIGSNCATEALLLALEHVKVHTTNVAELYNGKIRTEIK
jgi:hypothetical protein